MYIKYICMVVVSAPLSLLEKITVHQRTFVSRGFVARLYPICCGILDLLRYYKYIFHTYIRTVYRLFLHLNYMR